MASLFRPTYRDKTGQKRKAKKWYGQYVDADGRTRRIPLSPNKTVAQQMLNGLVRKSELGRVGIPVHFEEHIVRPLSEHLTAWEDSLRARGNTDKHVRMKLARVRRLVAFCKFRFVTDLSASRVETALAELREQATAAEANGKTDRFGMQTSNHYLAAMKQFARWLVKDRRMADSPLAHLEGGNVKLDRRHERRELSDDELARLLESVRVGKQRLDLDGLGREMLYLTAVYTGLPASELASLRPESFQLNSPTPTLTVEAGYSKHRREDILPLHGDFIDRIRPWLMTKPVGECLWPANGLRIAGPGRYCKRTLVPPAPLGSMKPRRPKNAKNAKHRPSWPIETPRAALPTFTRSGIRSSPG